MTNVENDVRGLRVEMDTRSYTKAKVDKKVSGVGRVGMNNYCTKAKTLELVSNCITPLEKKVDLGTRSNTKAVSDRKLADVTVYVRDKLNKVYTQVN